MGKTCFFIGHRETPDNILNQLQIAVEKHIIENGVTDFVIGQYGAFDRLAAAAVKNEKKRHPSVTLSLLLPYHPYNRPVQIPPGFDATFYPPGMERVPKRLAIIKANQYMVDNSDFLIAYVWHPASNARNLLEYARKRSIHVQNLAEPLTFR